MSTPANLLNQCPITRGCETRMSEETFRATCKITRNLKNKGKEKQIFTHEFCQRCKGEIHPKGLTFTEEFKEFEMKKIDQCELCGEMAELKQAQYINGGEKHEAKCCSKCAVVLMHVKVRPQAVVEGLRLSGILPKSKPTKSTGQQSSSVAMQEKIDKLNEQVSLLSKSTNNHAVRERDLEKELAEMKEALEVANRCLDEDEGLKQDLKKARELRTKAENAAKEINKTNISLVNENRDLQQQLASLRGLRKFAINTVFNVASGKVSGIDPADIDNLRIVAVQ